MRGEPWRNFNLVSAPCLSINAQFLPVPDRFVHGKITDTVLGTLHIATCNASSGRTVGVLFDVFDGVLKCTLRGPLEQVPCAAALAAAGVTVRREVSGCRLATMWCGLILEENLAAIEASDASFVRVHMERFNISLAGGARLSVVRDLIDRPDPAEMAQARLSAPLAPAAHSAPHMPGTHLPPIHLPPIPPPLLLPPQFDCSRLTKWVRAERACKVARAHMRGEAPLSAWLALGETDRLALFAFFTGGDRSKQLHFHNVRSISARPRLAPPPRPLCTSATWLICRYKSTASRRTHSTRCMGCWANGPSAPHP